MKFKELIENASTLQKFLGALAGIIAGSLPPFLNLSTATKGFGTFGGILGALAGGLVGLYYRHTAQVGGWPKPFALAVGSLLVCIVELNIASGALPSRYDWLTPVYDVIFTAPLLGSALFGFGYAAFWGAVTSLLRFLPGRVP